MRGQGGDIVVSLLGCGIENVIRLQGREPFGFIGWYRSFHFLTLNRQYTTSFHSATYHRFPRNQNIFCPLDVWCKYCRDWHHHGAGEDPINNPAGGDGHRVAHCFEPTPYSQGRDYPIKPPTLSGSMFAWNLISRFNQAVASGLYLFSVEEVPSGKRQVGKFVVIKSDLQEGY